MKLFYYAILASVANATQRVAPGYEDQIHCPPDNCQMYTNPHGLSGPRSTFNKCYNLATDETTDGVWTESRTNVAPPDDYIEPDECTGSEYSECDTDDDCSLEIDSSCRCYVNSAFHPFIDSSPSASDDQCADDECNGMRAWCSTTITHAYQGNADMITSSDIFGSCSIGYIPSPTSTPLDTPAPTTEKIPAQCDSHNECDAKMRGTVPGTRNYPVTGVGTCECYASSDLQPFDECEGDQLCISAGCSEDACKHLEARCYTSESYSSGDGAMGECTLAPSRKPVPLPLFPTPAPTTDKIPAQCDSDDQCSTMIRGSVPSPPFTGVGLCGCYASSGINEFDQCEGQPGTLGHCATARCVGTACDKFEAYCDIASDDNGMGECRLRFAEVSSSEANFAVA